MLLPFLVEDHSICVGWWLYSGKSYVYIYIYYIHIYTNNKNEYSPEAAHSLTNSYPKTPRNLHAFWSVSSLVENPLRSGRIFLTPPRANFNVFSHNVDPPKSSFFDPKKHVSEGVCFFEK